MFNVTALCATNKALNEDVVGFDGNCAWVIDGVTELYDSKIPEYSSEAQWFANEWGRYLHEHARDKKSLNQIMSEGATVVSSEYFALIPKADSNSDNRPGATIVLARISGLKLEYYILGDCYLGIKSGKNCLYHVDNRVQITEDKQIAALQKLQQERNLYVEDARAVLSDYYKKTRSCKNTDSGYWVLEPGVDTIKYGITGQFDLDEDAKVLLMSDGFYRLVDTFFYYSSMEDLFGGISRYGLQKLFNKITRLENSDAECVLFKRTKKSDDCSAILINV